MCKYMVIKCCKYIRVLHTCFRCCFNLKFTLRCLEKIAASAKAADYIKNLYEEQKIKVNYLKNTNYFSKILNNTYLNINA